MKAAIQANENGLTFADHVRHWEQVCAATAADIERCPYDERLERDLVRAEIALGQAQRRALKEEADYDGTGWDGEEFETRAGGAA